MGLPYNGSMNTGRWALDFTVVYQIATTIQDGSASISSTTEYSTSTFIPESLGYTCTAECKHHFSILKKIMPMNRT